MLQFYGLLNKMHRVWVQVRIGGGWGQKMEEGWTLGSEKGGEWGQKKEEGWRPRSEKRGWRLGSEKGGRVEAGVRNGRKGGAWGQKKLWKKHCIVQGIFFFKLRIRGTLGWTHHDCVTHFLVPCKSFRHVKLNLILIYTLKTKLSLYDLW